MCFVVLLGLLVKCGFSVFSGWLFCRFCSVIRLVMIWMGWLVFLMLLNMGMLVLWLSWCSLVLGKFWYLMLL